MTSEMTSRTQFIHTRNKNGSYKSICTWCYQTVISPESATELEIRAADRHHFCNQANNGAGFVAPGFQA